MNGILSQDELNALLSKMPQDEPRDLSAREKPVDLPEPANCGLDRSDRTSEDGTSASPGRASHGPPSADTE